jgi:hypothetical protein
VSPGVLDVAVTRIDHADAGGSGMIGSLKLLIDSNYSGQLELSISNIRVVKSNGEIVPSTGLPSTTQVTSIADLITGNSFSVYPNPANDIITIAGTKGIKAYSLYDLAGKIVTSEVMVNTGSTTINVTSLTSGLYFLKIATETGFETYKVIKN